MDTSFEAARIGLRQTGGSVGSQELVEMLCRHGSEEGRLLEEYRRFADDAPSAAARYLVQLIVDDETRHHRLLTELANAIAWGGDEHAPCRKVPSLAAPPDGREQQALRHQTLLLLRAEKRDHRELRQLRRSLHPYADTTLWSLIVDLMLLDTEKHARILEFIADHTRGR